MSAPTVNNSNLAYVTNPGTGCQMTATCAAGHGLAVMAYGAQSAGVLTISDGHNTYTAATANPIQENSNSTQMYVWWVPNNSFANPTFTVSGASGQFETVLGYADISGQNTSSFIDQQSGLGSANGAYLSNPVTPSSASDLVIAFAASPFTGAAYGVGTGYSILQSLTTNRDAAIAYISAPASGVATNPSWTNTDGSSGGCSFTMAIKAGSTPIVRPSQFFLGRLDRLPKHGLATGLALAPLLWAIGRRNKLSGKK